MLKGSKIYLRALEPTDLPLLAAWENNLEFWQVGQTLQPFSNFTLELYLQNAHQTIVQAGQFRFVIVANATQKPLGTLDLFDFDPINQRVGLGILIAERANRQKGYAAEALHLALKYCFEVILVNQVFCNILETNHASLGLFQKHGFEILGRKKAWVRSASGFEDELMLQCFQPKV